MPGRRTATLLATWGSRYDEACNDITSMLAKFAWATSGDIAYQCLAATSCWSRNVATVGAPSPKGRILVVALAGFLSGSYTRRRRRPMATRVPCHCPRPRPLLSGSALHLGRDHRAPTVSCRHGFGIPSMPMRATPLRQDSRLRLMLQTRSARECRSGFASGPSAYEPSMASSFGGSASQRRSRS